jgi:hypothetical protein
LTGPDRLDIRRTLTVTVAVMLAVWGTAAGLLAASVFHPRVHGWLLAAAVGVALPAGLAAQVWAAIRGSRRAWAALPACLSCGHKMVPADVRVSWARRLRYYRCRCGCGTVSR